MLELHSLQSNWPPRRTSNCIIYCLTALKIPSLWTFVHVLTLQCPRRQDVFVHVIKVIREEQVLRGRRSQAEEGWVQVKGGSQSRQPGVTDDTEAGQRLDLLPAVELLPESRRHLTQGLSEGEGRDEEHR